VIVYDLLFKIGGEEGGIKRIFVWWWNKQVNGKAMPSKSSQKQSNELIINN